MTDDLAGEQLRAVLQFLITPAIGDFQELDWMTTENRTVTAGRDR